MEFKQFLIKKLLLFFTLSTLITIAVFILGTSQSGNLLKTRTETGGVDPA